MSGSGSFTADLVVNVVGDRVDDLPLPPVAPRKPTPRQQARTAASTPEPTPEPQVDAPAGPELELFTQIRRQPRGGIMLVGMMPDGVTKVSKRADHLLKEMDVTNNRFFSADSFSCTLALYEFDPDFDPAFWADVERLDVELFSGEGVDEPPGESLLAGRADEIQIDLDGRTVTLRGRDYTADLIEMRLAEKYPNKTASEIVRILAGKAGLEADVTETQKLAGVYYKAEHAQLADETTAWNLITYLAEREGFDALVQGRTVIFKLPPDEKSAPHWTIKYEPRGDASASPRAPVTGLSLTKGLTISRDIKVRVISWNSSKKHSLEGTSESKKKGRNASGQFQASVTHVFRKANLTQDQADALARQYAIEITRNLRSIDIDTAALPGLNIRSIIRLTGTGGSFDLPSYHIDEIQWRMSQNQGFKMGLRCRNIIPTDTAAL